MSATSGDEKVNIPVREMGPTIHIGPLTPRDLFYRLQATVLKELNCEHVWQDRPLTIQDLRRIDEALDVEMVKAPSEVCNQEPTKATQ